MDRQTIKFKHGEHDFEMFAIPTIHEDNRIEDIAASYTSPGLEALEKFRNVINMKEKYSLECAQRDEKGNMVLSDTPGMYLIDTTHEKFSIYLYFKNLVDSCYFYAKMKVLLVSGPIDFNIDEISTKDFNMMRSAFEVALNNFQTSAGAT